MLQTNISKQLQQQTDSNGMIKVDSNTLSFLSKSVIQNQVNNDISTNTKIKEKTYQVQRENHVENNYSDSDMDHSILITVKKSKGNQKIVTQPQPKEIKTQLYQQQQQQKETEQIKTVASNYNTFDHLDQSQMKQVPSTKSDFDLVEANIILTQTSINNSIRSQLQESDYSDSGLNIDLIPKQSIIKHKTPQTKPKITNQNISVSQNKEKSSLNAETVNLDISIKSSAKSNSRSFTQNTIAEDSEVNIPIINRPEPQMQNTSIIEEMNELRKKTRPKPKNTNKQNFLKPESHPETINLIKSPPKLPQSPIQSSSSSDTRKLILSQKINTIRPQNKPKPPKPKSRKIVVERPPVQNPRDNMEQIQREKAEKILSMLERVDSAKVSRSNSIYDSDIENEDEIIQEQIIKIDSLQSSGIIKQKESFDLSKVQTMKVNNAQQQISQIQQSSQIEQQSTNIQVKLVPKPQLNQITVNQQLEIQYQQPKIKVIRATEGKQQQQDNVDNNNGKLNVQIQEQNNEIDTIRTLRKLNKPKGVTFNFETNEVEYNKNNSIIESNYQQSPINLKNHNINNQYSNIIRNEQKENLDNITKPTYKRQQAPTLDQQDYFNSQITQQNIQQNPNIWTHQAASIPAPPDVVVVKKVAPPVPSHEYPPQNQTQPLNNELPKQAPMQQQRSLSQTQEVEVIEAAPKVEPVQAKQAPKLPASNAPPKGNMKAIFNFSEYVFDEDPDNKVDYQMMEPKKKKPEAPKAEKEPEVQAVSAQPSEVKEEPKPFKITPKISIPPQAKIQPKIPGKAPEQTDSKPEAEKPKDYQNTKTSAPPKGNMKAIFNFSEYVFDEDPDNKVDYQMMEPKKKKTEPAQVKEPEPAAQLAEVKPVEKQPTEKQKEELVTQAKQAVKAAPLKVQLPLPPNKIQPKIPGKAPVVPKATSVPQQQEAKLEGEPKTQPPSGNMKAIFNFSEYVFDEDPENKVDYEMLEPKKKKTEKEPEAPKTEKEPEVQAVSLQPSEVKEEAKPKITPKINIPPQVKIQPKIQQKIQIPSKDQNETKISEEKQSTLNDNKPEQDLQTIKTDQKPVQNQGIQSIKPANSIKPPLKIPPKQASLLTQQNLTKPSNTNLQNQQISLDLGDLEQNLSKEPEVVEEVKITKVAPKIIVPPKIQMKLPVKK
ncbi:Hypothetical_protein [Hexamita inflata]|uniref:Hypothetical_protein n=1 Tax=Hexamita inflata TaxID=28002 RepID=A0AA86TLQ0_9EUKA|nr:Hypothetical protein HINF_LOCUS4278 [Hexamita inflata]